MTSLLHEMYHKINTGNCPKFDKLHVLIACTKMQSDYYNRKKYISRGIIV